MNGARLLFEQYCRGGEAYLNGLVGNEIETNFQDFKGFKSTNPNNWGSDDRKSLAEGLSGFANADGGVIIWGVDVVKGPVLPVEMSFRLLNHSQI